MRIMVACRAVDNIAGGVERQAVRLLNEMAARGHEVSFFTWDPKSATTFYELDERVTWHRLGMGDSAQKATWSLRFARLKAIRTMVKDVKPDIIIAFQHGTFLSLRLFLMGLGVPIVASLRNALSILKFSSTGSPKFVIFQTLRMASGITVQFENYRKDYPGFLSPKIYAVPNAIEQAETIAKPDVANDTRYKLLTVGRYSFQKNYPILIKAFIQVAAECPDWDLIIAGDGEQRAVIEELVEESGLSERITLLGAVQDVNALYQSSHLFCLPSLWEGFPNALSEALAHGLPSVGFKECAGVNELIKDGVNGLLADNNEDEAREVDVLADAFKILMHDHEKRKVMGRAAVETMEAYKPETVYDLWESLFQDIQIKRSA